MKCLKTAEGFSIKLFISRPDLEMLHLKADSKVDRIVSFKFFWLDSRAKEESHIILKRQTLIS